MKTEKPFDYQKVVSPPPGAGRTFSSWANYQINAWHYGYIGWIDHLGDRQLAAERDANTPPRDGGDTGNAFPIGADLAKRKPVKRRARR